MLQINDDALFHFFYCIFFHKMNNLALVNHQRFFKIQNEIRAQKDDRVEFRIYRILRISSLFLPLFSYTREFLNFFLGGKMDWPALGNFTPTKNFIQNEFQER